jgi:NADP-dependent 3-hydroxy acid dehydrogenase YdfG
VASKKETPSKEAERSQALRRIDLLVNNAGILSQATDHRG